MTEFATLSQVAKHGRKQKLDVPVLHWPLCCHGDGDLHGCRSLHLSLFGVITDNKTNPIHSLLLSKVFHWGTWTNAAAHNAVADMMWLIETIKLLSSPNLESCWVQRHKLLRSTAEWKYIQLSQLAFWYYPTRLEKNFPLKAKYVVDILPSHTTQI